MKCDAVRMILKGRLVDLLNCAWHTNKIQMSYLHKFIAWTVPYEILNSDPGMQQVTHKHFLQGSLTVLLPPRVSVPTY